MAISTLVNCGLTRIDVQERAAQWLVAAQREDGSWPARAFYAGPEPPAVHAYYWGSEELTTAMCLEALARLADSD